MNEAGEYIGGVPASMFNGESIQDQPLIGRSGAHLVATSIIAPDLSHANLRIVDRDSPKCNYAATLQQGVLEVSYNDQLPLLFLGYEFWVPNRHHPDFDLGPLFRATMEMYQQAGLHIKQINSQWSPENNRTSWSKYQRLRGRGIIPELAVAGTSIAQVIASSTRFRSIAAGEFIGNKGKAQKVYVIFEPSEIR